MRDYVITRCLLDLGLRRMEVARSCLDDIDCTQEYGRACQQLASGTDLLLAH